MAYCKACIEKDLKIAALQEAIKGLKAQLHYRERKEEEGPFGLSTPSSKAPFKKNAPEEKTNKKGGAVPGHTGHGRTSITEETADLVIDRDAGDTCPECGTPLVPAKKTNRTVIDNAPREPKKILMPPPPQDMPELQEGVHGKGPGSSQKPLREPYHRAIRRHALLPRHPHGENL